MKPRNTSQGTRAEGQLQRVFWAEYVRSYLLGGTDEVVGDARSVFTDVVLDRLRATGQLHIHLIAHTLARCDEKGSFLRAIALGSAGNSYPVHGKVKQQNSRGMYQLSG